jgi:hypothetical protein
MVRRVIASRVVYWHICQGDPVCGGETKPRSLRKKDYDEYTECRPSAQPQLVPRRLLQSGQVHHPAVLDEARRRSQDLQLHLADRITSFAGSMKVVWLHVALFAAWMLLLERSPWPTLTLVVSLEAIFLSTFVMIGQNRQATFQQAKADHDSEAQELELKTTTELTNPYAYAGIAPQDHWGTIGASRLRTAAPSSPRRATSAPKVRTPRPEVAARIPFPDPRRVYRSHRCRYPNWGIGGVWESRGRE